MSIEQFGGVTGADESSIEKEDSGPDTLTLDQLIAGLGSVGTESEEVQAEVSTETQEPAPETQVMDGENSPEDDILTSEMVESFRDSIPAEVWEQKAEITKEMLEAMGRSTKFSGGAYYAAAVNDPLLHEKYSIPRIEAGITAIEKVVENATLDLDKELYVTWGKDRGLSNSKERLRNAALYAVRSREEQLPRMVEAKENPKKVFEDDQESLRARYSMFQVRLGFGDMGQFSNMDLKRNPVDNGPSLVQALRKNFEARLDREWVDSSFPLAAEGLIEAALERQDFETVARALAFIEAAKEGQVNPELLKKVGEATAVLDDVARSDFGKKIRVAKAQQTQYSFKNVWR